MNIKTNEVYEKNLEKLEKIKEEVQITSQFCMNQDIEANINA